MFGRTGPGSSNWKPTITNNSAKPFPQDKIENYSLKPKIPQIPNLIAGQLTADILLSLLSMICNDQRPSEEYKSLFCCYATTALRLALVCKDWSTLIFSDSANMFWKKVAIYFRWPYLKLLQLKVRNWYKFIKQRVTIQQHALMHFSVDDPPNSSVSLVENCKLIEADETEWIQKCPQLFESLSDLEDEYTRLCSVCNQQVHLVFDTEEVKKHITESHCIAFYASKTHEKLAKLKHKGLIGMDVFWRTKDDYDDSSPCRSIRKVF